MKNIESKKCFCLLKNNKIYFLFTFLFGLLFHSCVNPTYEFEYKPGIGEEIIYRSELSYESKSFTLENRFTCVEKGNDYFNFENEILKMEWYEDGQIDSETNELYEGYIGEINSFDLNAKGSLKNHEEISEIFNLQTYFLEYPDRELYLAESWVSEQEIVDLMFSKFTATYTLISIENDIAIIHISGEFTAKDNELGLSKTVVGSYEIDKTTGLLQFADLETSGFNGIKTVNTKIRIQRIFESDEDDFKF